MSHHTKKKAEKAKKDAKAKEPGLESIQRTVAALVMRPLTKNDEMQRKWMDGRETAEVVEQVIKRNDRLSSFERIEIYNKQYWFRLRDCFADDFPGLRAVLGDQAFARLTDAYLAENPSRSFSLRNLGQFLIGFLEKHPELTAPWSELAIDMARFEWAQVLAFDEAGHAAVSPKDLPVIARNPAKARLLLQPYVQLLDLRYPLDDFLLAVKKKNRALRGEASNAVEEGGRRRATKATRRPRAQQIWLVVHRFENSLYYKRVDQAAFNALVGLREGKTLGVAVADAIAQSDSHKDWSVVIRQWFETWTRLGWFYLPKKIKTN